MESHAIQSVHIQLATNYKDSIGISKIRDFLFEKTGKCLVYFHIDTGNNPYVIQANDQLRINPTLENLNELKEFDYVKNVWTE